MQLWLPGYEHQPEHGAGLSVAPGAPKVVIHTTESGPGSLQRVRDTWRGPANWGKGLPHFIAEGRRYVQLLPLNVGAYTLENRAGGADTNRGGPAIQVEIVGYARNGLTAVDVEALGRWLADLVLAGLPINLTQHPPFYGEGAGWILAAYEARQRMSADAYARFNGFMGHQHCPENAHWDPGHLDGDRVERIARAHLAGAANQPTPQEDPHMAKIVFCPEHTGGVGWLTLPGMRRLGLANQTKATVALKVGDADGQVELRGAEAWEYLNDHYETPLHALHWGSVDLMTMGVERNTEATGRIVNGALANLGAPAIPAGFASDVAAKVLAEVGHTVEDAAARGVDRELDALSD